jgi:hypothetical protein
VSDGEPDDGREPERDGGLRDRFEGDPRSRLGLPSDFSRAQRAFALGGLIAVAIAVVGLLVPSLTPPPVRAVVTALPAGVTLFLLVLLGIVLGVASSRRQPSSVEPVERQPLHEPRQPAARSPAVGWSVEDLLTEATDLDRDREYRAAVRANLRDRLREAATHALVRETDASRAAVETALDEGTWTTDRRASALLGEPGAPRPPWYVRLWDLLRSEPAVRRRTRHALRAVERARERGTLAPPREPPDTAENVDTNDTPSPAGGATAGGER